MIINVESLVLLTRLSHGLCRQTLVSVQTLAYNGFLLGLFTDDFLIGKFYSNFNDTEWQLV